MLDSALWDWVSSCSPHDNTSSDLFSFGFNFFKHTISMLSVSGAFCLFLFFSPTQSAHHLEDRTDSSSSCASALSLAGLEQVRPAVCRANFQRVGGG